MSFKQFEGMHVMHHAKQLGILQFYKQLFKQLTQDDLESVKAWCNNGFKRYYGE